MKNEISIPEDQYLTETEMADALDISVETLRGACDPLVAKRIDPDLVTYTFTLVHDGEFHFRRAVFEENLLKQAAYRDLKESGEWTNPEACNRWLGYHTRAGIISVPVTATMVNHLRTFVEAWERFDIGYSTQIAHHARYISDLRDIWTASRYLDGIPHVKTRHAVTLIGEPYGATGKLIPFQWLRYAATRGLFDRREHEDDGEFIPALGNTYQALTKDSVLAPGDYILLDADVESDEAPDVGMIVAVDDDEVAFTLNGRSIRYTDRRWITHYCNRK